MMETIQTTTIDVAVIGAGAAGLSAAAVTAAAGRSTVVIDREGMTGGILRQCIHNGFGLRYFKEELTGPEFAQRMFVKARDAGARFQLDATVT
jgi:thioredoxin reductase